MEPKERKCRINHTNEPQNSTNKLHMLIVLLP
jgi:hypothetical protein